MVKQLNQNLQSGTPRKMLRPAEKFADYAAIETRSEMKRIKLEREREGPAHLFAPAEGATTHRVCTERRVHQADVSGASSAIVRRPCASACPLCNWNSSCFRRKRNRCTPGIRHCICSYIGFRAAPRPRCNSFERCNYEVAPRFSISRSRVSCLIAAFSDLTLLQVIDDVPVPLSFLLMGRSLAMGSTPVYFRFENLRDISKLSEYSSRFPVQVFAISFILPAPLDFRRSIWLDDTHPGQGVVPKLPLTTPAIREKLAAQLQRAASLSLMARDYFPTISRPARREKSGQKLDGGWRSPGGATAGISMGGKSWR